MSEKVRLGLNPLPLMTPADRLRELASQIQTVDEFEQAMSQVVPEMREEVRALIEPMLSFDLTTGEPRTERACH